MSTNLTKLSEDPKLTKQLLADGSDFYPMMSARKGEDLFNFSKK